MDQAIVAALIAGAASILAIIIGSIFAFYQTGRNEKVLEKRQEVQIEQIAKAKPENIQEVAASQLAIITSFNESVLRQAQQSFNLALAAAAIGLIFFIAAVGFLLVSGTQAIATVSIISGALVEVISAVNFYLYGKASSQFSIFHNRLDRIQYFLLANSICESLVDNLKQETRAEIVRMIMSAAVGLDKEKVSKEKAK
jgi:hypothetical protein